MSRGLANCNPGNIRRSATRFRGEVVPSRDPAFKQFESLAWGYRALFVLFDTYRRRYGLRRLDVMIARWAPPVENDTEAYVRGLCRMTGFAPAQEIDPHDRSTMLPLAAAMTRIENGAEADAEAVAEGWRLFENSKLKIQN